MMLEVRVIIVCVGWGLTFHEGGMESGWELVDFGPHVGQVVSAFSS